MATRGGFAANGAACVVGKGVPCAPHLPCAGAAPQLPCEFTQLRDPGSTHRMAACNEAAARVHRQAPVSSAQPSSVKAGPPPTAAEAQAFVHHQFAGGGRVVHLGDRNVVRRRSGHCVSGLRRVLDGASRQRARRAGGAQHRCGNPDGHLRAIAA